MVFVYVYVYRGETALSYKVQANISCTKWGVRTMNVNNIQYLYNIVQYSGQVQIVLKRVWEQGKQYAVMGAFRPTMSNCFIFAQMNDASQNFPEPEANLYMYIYGYWLHIVHNVFHLKYHLFFNIIYPEEIENALLCLGFYV